MADEKETHQQSKVHYESDEAVIQATLLKKF